MKFSTRLTLAITLVLILPVTASLLLISLRMADVLRNDASHQLELSAKALADHVNRWDAQTVLALHFLAAQPDIVSMDAARQKPVLESMTRVYEHLYMASTSGLDGLNLARSDANPPLQYGDRAWFQNALAGHPVTRQVLISRTSQEPGVCLSTGIHDASRIVGVAVACTGLKVLAKQVGAIRIGRTGYAYVVDEQGQVLAHPDPAFSPSDRLVSLGQLPVVKDVVRHRKSGLAEYTDPGLEGKTWYTYTLPLDNGWGVVVQQHQAEVLAGLAEFWTFALALAVCTVLFIGLFTFFAAKRLMQPIVTLSEAAADLARGNRKRRVRVRCRDEVGRLGESFNQMGEELESLVHDLESQIAARTHEIRSLNEQLRQDNSRMEAELDVTRRIQQLILPRPDELKQVPHFDIAGFMEAASEVGGDYYDVLQHHGRVQISIGDVTGHGLESGMVMLMAQTAMRTLFEAGIDSPERCLSVLNGVLRDNMARMGSDKTMTLSVIDVAGDRLIASGQHEELLIVRRDRSIERVDTFPLGFMVGLEPSIDAFLGRHEFSLEPGDGFVLYTDGITEAWDEQHQQFGVDRLCEVISRHWHLPADDVRLHIVSSVYGFMPRGVPQVDDLTVVVVKRV